MNWTQRISKGKSYLAVLLNIFRRCSGDDVTEYLLGKLYLLRRANVFLGHVGFFPLILVPSTLGFTRVLSLGEQHLDAPS